MFARSDDPYRGADLVTSRRATAALIGFTGLLSLAFLSTDPPTDGMGDAGWVLASALIAANFAGVRELLRRETDFDDMLLAALLVGAQVAVLVWLAGGVSSDYEDLYVFALGAGLVQPPRRAVLQLLFVSVCLCLPLAYQGTGSVAEAKLAAEVVQLVAMAGVIVPMLFVIRRRRLELEEGAEVARRLARVDPLTGLSNRRAFDEALTVEIARSEREGGTMSVALVDLDGLKRLNDVHGHLAGDQVLAKIGRTLESTIRTGDTCYRWGGDEFAVLLPDTDRDAARFVLDRTAERISRDCQNEDGQPLDVSYGVAELEQGGSAEDLLALADLALMEHKTEKRRGG
jgi:diguanylate cyclase (GGDEF)-like protein